MKRWLPWILAIGCALLGIIVIVAGFFYDVTYAGIPYQDPTPEMQAKWQYHSDVAATIRWSGACITALGFLGGAAIGIWRLSAAARED